MKKTYHILFATILAFSFTACGRIPSAYQGKFHDAETNTQLELSGNSGIFSSLGQAVRSSAQTLRWELLSQGRPGLYLQTARWDSQTIEVYWLSPKRDTIRNEFGFISMESGILYTQLNSHPESRVDNISARYCTNGQIIVDSSTHQFSGGCPSGSPLLQFQRF